MAEGLWSKAFRSLVRTDSGRSGYRGAAAILLANQYYKGQRDSFLERLDQYQRDCDMLSDLLPPYRPGLPDRMKRERAGDPASDPADVLGVVQIEIRYAKEKLTEQEYPTTDPTRLIRDCERNIRSGLDSLLTRFTRMGLSQERNPRKPRELDRLEIARNTLIRQSVDALMATGLKLTAASVKVGRDHKLTGRQVRSICTKPPSLTDKNSPAK